MTVKMLRRRVDDIARELARADPDGNTIEHCNAEALCRIRALGLALERGKGWQPPLPARETKQGL